MSAGGSHPTKDYQTPNAMLEMHGSQTAGDKFRGQKGNSPDLQLRGCGISQTTRMLAQKQPHIQRVRNSSLVERSCADNYRG